MYFHTGGKCRASVPDGTTKTAYLADEKNGLLELDLADGAYLVRFGALSPAGCHPVALQSDRRKGGSMSDKRQKCSHGLEEEATLGPTVSLPL